MGITVNLLDVSDRPGLEFGVTKSTLDPLSVSMLLGDGDLASGDVDLASGDVDPATGEGDLGALGCPFCSLPLGLTDLVRCHRCLCGMADMLLG